LPGSPRMTSMLYLPFNDHNAAYKMVQDFGDKPGVIGFMVTSVRHKPVHDNDYMKTYALIEEMGLPLGFHSGFNWDDPMFRTSNRFIAVHALGFTWYNVVHCTNWIVNGLPERFPKLPVIWIESGVTWISWLMTRLDNEYRMRSSECPSLKMLPSEYMKQMYYSTQRLRVSRGDVQVHRRREHADVCVRLSALGHGPAERDLGPSVPRRKSQTQDPRRERPRRLQP